MSRSSRSPGEYKSSKNPNTWRNYVMQALHPFFKEGKIEKEAFKMLAKSLTESCCKGNFNWLWPSVLDIYKSKNEAKIKQMEGSQLKIGPLVVQWLKKHVTKFMEQHGIARIEKDEKCENFKKYLVAKITKYKSVKQK